MKRKIVTTKWDQVDKQLVEEAYELYKNGASLTELGKKYGCAPNTVRARFGELGLPIRTRGSAGHNRKIHDGNKQVLLDMYQSTDPAYALEEIAQALDLNVYTVRDWLNDNGHPQPDRRHHGKEIKDAVLDDYSNSDMTLPQIKMKHGVSLMTIIRWVNQEGIPHRKRGRRKK